MLIPSQMSIVDVHCCVALQALTSRCCSKRSIAAGRPAAVKALSTDSQVHMAVVRGQQGLQHSRLLNITGLAQGRRCEQTQQVDATMSMQPGRPQQTLLQRHLQM